MFAKKNAYLAKTKTLNWIHDIFQKKLERLISKEWDERRT